LSNINYIARNSKVNFSAFMLALVTGVSPSYADATTAGGLMEKPIAERTMYIMGVVDGLAYARFRKDTLAKGARDEAGMNCILGWFSDDSLSRLLEIERTLAAYADEYPITVLASMVKRECGE